LPNLGISLPIIGRLLAHSQGSGAVLLIDLAADEMAFEVEVIVDGSVT
jgi:hypothetical protein